jgi:hypothetical protein
VLPSQCIHRRWNDLKGEATTAIGPVQLLVLGFNQPDFHGEIREELDRLRDNDLVRVIDALALAKDADGNVATLHQSQLSNDEQEAFGALVGGLIGLGAAGEEGFELGAERGAERCDRPGRGMRLASGSSAPSTWSPSGWSGPRRPPPWRPPRATPSEPNPLPRRNQMLGPSRRTVRRNVGVAPVAAAAVVAAPTAGRRVARRTSRRVARRY